MGVVCLVFGFGDRVACNPGRSQTNYVAKADLEHHVFCEESSFKIFSLNYFNGVEKEARVEGEGKDSKAACMGAALTGDRVHLLAPRMRTLNTLIAGPFSYFNEQFLLLQV